MKYVTNTDPPGYKERVAEITKELREKQKRDPLLVERSKTHGSFEKNAEISQALKRLFRENMSPNISDIHREALDQIAMKLSRILSGHAEFRDHWADLSGYSLLALEACKD